MEIRYGVLGRLPFAETGEGEPLVVLSGLWPTTGFRGTSSVRIALGPLAELAGSRRLVLFNRRPGLEAGTTMADLAAEHLKAIEDGFGDEPVDLAGTSTGGSIAQQIAADHPQAVRRLVLISTACRLGPFGRSVQRDVAARIRRGDRRRAFAALAAGLVPPRRGRTAVAAAALAAPPGLIADDQAWADLATTIEAEDGFDLARCAPIEAPSLLLAGADDRFYSPPLFEETAALIPNSRLCLLPGRGHVTVTRDPAFLDEVRRFLG